MKTSLMALALGAAAVSFGTTVRAQGAWESLGGSLRSLPECLEVGNSDHCWGFSAGTPTLSWWLDGTPNDLGGAIRGAPECVARGGEITCVAPAVLPGGGLATIVYDGDAWGPWSVIGVAPLRQKPACVIQGNETVCVALGDDTTGWWVYTLGGGDPTRIDFPAGVRSTLRPMCELAAEGTHCFMVASGSGQLWTIIQAKDGTWGDWQPLQTGVPIGETPHCLASGVRLDCFARTGGTDPLVTMRLISASFDGSSWSQWTVVGDATVQSQPYCNKLGSGFDCYYTSPNGELRRRQLDNRIWQDEVNLGGTVRARPECLAEPGGQEIDCYLQGADNTLHHLAVE